MDRHNQEMESKEQNPVNFSNFGVSELEYEEMEKETLESIINKIEQIEYILNDGCIDDLMNFKDKLQPALNKPVKVNIQKVYKNKVLK